MAKYKVVVRDEVAEVLYGIGDHDDELPALEKHIREQGRIAAELEAELEAAEDALSMDPLERLIALEDAGDYHFHN